MVESNLLFAIPKKGRIYDQCLELLKGADILYTRKSRLDIAQCTNLPITLVFLPAKDIARFVGEGNVDLGITGQDMIAESNLSHQVDELLNLHFGNCKLQIQVPVDSPYTDPAQLVGKRIATSFYNIAKNYFNPKLDQNQLTEIKLISGSVEAACSLGLADAIIDLVESGETMRAANLRPISTLLQTQSVLICNHKKHSDNPERKALIDKIYRRFLGLVNARKYVMVNYNIEESKFALAKVITPGKKSPTVTLLSDEGLFKGWIAVSAMVDRKESVNVMDRLEQVGATDILVFNIQNCRG